MFILNKKSLIQNLFTTIQTPSFRHNCIASLPLSTNKGQTQSLENKRILYKIRVGQSMSSPLQNMVLHQATDNSNIALILLKSIMRSFSGS